MSSVLTPAGPVSVAPFQPCGGRGTRNISKDIKVRVLRVPPRAGSLSTLPPAAGGLAKSVHRMP